MKSLRNGQFLIPYYEIKTYLNDILSEQYSLEGIVFKQYLVNANLLARGWGV